MSEEVDNGLRREQHDSTVKQFKSYLNLVTSVVLSQRINKSREVYNKLHKIWGSSQNSLNTKNAFIQLERNLKITWTDRISNDRLRKLAGQNPVTEETKHRKWSWIFIEMLFFY